MRHRHIAIFLPVLATAACLVGPTYHRPSAPMPAAYKELAEKQVVQLDDERKAAMVSNLMVVLCGESEVHPVVNTGTLYS